MTDALRGQKKILDILKLELHVLLVTLHVLGIEPGITRRVIVLLVLIYQHFLRQSLM